MQDGTLHISSSTDKPQLRMVMMSLEKLLTLQLLSQRLISKLLHHGKEDFIQLLSQLPTISHHMMETLELLEEVNIYSRLLQVMVQDFILMETLLLITGDSTEEEEERLSSSSLKDGIILN